MPLLPQLNKLHEVLVLALKVFPEDYWLKIYYVRKYKDPKDVPNNCPKLIPFGDIFQHTFKRQDEKTGLVNPFCTVPKSSDHWDIVLAMYTIMDPDMWPTPMAVARDLVTCFQPALKDGKLLNPDSIHNFGDDVFCFLLRTANGERENKFLGNPAECICELLTFLDDCGGPENKGANDQAREQVRNSLKKEIHSKAFQKDLDELALYIQDKN